MRKELNSVNWEEEMRSIDANNAWKLFANKIQEVMEKCIPKTKSRSGKGPEMKRKPLWMNKDAMQRVKKKYQAWKRYTNTRQYRDYEAYCKARNEVTKEVRKAKRSYEKKLAEEIKDNPKSFWKYVRDKTNVKQGVSDLEKEDGSFAHTDEEKAEKLNKFFSSVFTIEDDSDIPEPDLKHIGDTLSSITISREEVKKKLQKMNASKSHGPD